jgi:hypothetical protein
MLNYYDLAHGKRKNEPRPQLLNQFTPEELQAMKEKAETWPQYHYLKQRHLLVELRREQYTLRDAYAEPVPLNETIAVSQPAPPPSFGCEVEVLPLGLVTEQDTATLIFQPWDKLIPANFEEEELVQISNFYWEKKKAVPSGQRLHFDFRELEHVYQFFMLYLEMDDAAAGADLESTLPELMATLRFYVDRADLTELQLDILKMKLERVRN